MAWTFRNARQVCPDRPGRGSCRAAKSPGSSVTRFDLLPTAAPASPAAAGMRRIVPLRPGVWRAVTSAPTRKSLYFTSAAPGGIVRPCFPPRVRPCRTSLPGSRSTVAVWGQLAENVAAWARYCSASRCSCLPPSSGSRVVTPVVV